MKIAQYLPSFHPADAIGNYVAALDGIFRQMGHQTQIFSISANTAKSLQHTAADISTDDLGEQKARIYHFSTGSEMTRHFVKGSGKRIIVYHNITPPEFFVDFNFQKAAQQMEGLKQLGLLCAKTHLALAVSEFNRKALAEKGFKHTDLIPLSLEKFAAKKADPATLERYTDGVKNFLFVGRLCPHKKIEDLMQTLYWCKNTTGLSCRLIVAGSWEGMESYKTYLDGVQKSLGLEGSVVFAGRVSQSVLEAFYRCADLFLCMSEHEGVCVPLVESCALGVPVMAFDAGAIRETLGGAGVLIKEKNFAMTAELAARICTDEKLSHSLKTNQYNVVERFTHKNLETTLREKLALWLK